LQNKEGQRQRAGKRRGHRGAMWGRSVYQRKRRSLKPDFKHSAEIKEGRVDKVVKTWNYKLNYIKKYTGQREKKKRSYILDRL